MVSPRVTQQLAKASRALTRNADARLAPLGLRFAQVPVIVLLRSNGGMTQKALAEAVGVEQPSMAQTLARMERNGLINRVAHPDDARSHVNTLSEGQQTLVQQAQRQLEILEQEATNGLTPTEISTLQRLLGKVTDNLQTHVEAAAPATRTNPSGQ